VQEVGRQKKKENVAGLKGEGMRAVRVVTLFAVVAMALGASLARGGGADPGLQVGFGVRRITPVGAPPAEWDQYFTEQLPKTHVWGEPFVDLNDDGCMSGLTNHNLEPLLDAAPPRGETPEPHIDQPWNSAGDADRAGAFSVRGVTIVGDPLSTGKWDGLWANAGFGSRCAEGMHDDTWARAVVVQAGGKTVAMVSIDVVGFFHLEIDRARAELKVRYPNLPIDELMVSSTHTHEGVDTMGYWGQLYLNTDGKFPAYQAFIRSQILDAVNEAYGSLEPASVRFGVGHYSTAIRDSRPPQVIDDEVVSAQFLRDNGSTIGTVVNWSNHPEAQGSENGLISSDFPHGARVTLEADLGGTAVYFSGSVGGLMTPLGTNVPGFGSSVSWERTFEIGRQVALQAEAALAGQPLHRPTSLSVQRRSWYMDMDNNVLRALNIRGIFDLPTFAGGESWGLSNHQDGIPLGTVGPQIQTEMVSLRLGPAVFITVPGELTPELEIGGFGRPDCSSADTGRPYEPPINTSFTESYRFVLGLGQDELGYIIPGYDFHILSLPEERPDGRGIVPVGGLEVATCGEGHYEETVSGSSVFAPWVTCVAAELSGKDPWTDSTADPYKACSHENTHRPPYGIDPAG
jgi:hypothetical protein